MSSKDWLEKDFYAVLGVRRPPPPTRSRRRTASSPGSCTRTTTPATATPRSGSRPSPRRTTCSPTSASGAEYDEMRSLFGSGAFRRNARAGGQAGGPFDMTDIFGDGGGGRPVTSASAAPASPTCSARSSPVAAAPAPARRRGPAARSRRRGRGDAGLRRRGARRDAADHAARAGRLRHLPRQRREAGHPAADLPGLPRLRPGHHATRARSASPSRAASARASGTVVDEKCPECHGTGGVTKTRTLNVRIPAGVADGQRIRLAGRGEPGERGGPAGDLYVLVKVRAGRAVRPGRRRPDADRADHASPRRCSAPTCGCRHWTVR